MQASSLTVKAFSLLELIVVITILGLIALSAYIPYAHHQKKVLLKQASKEISQSLRDVRSLAINGINTGSGNVNTALLISTGATDLKYYSYDLGTNLDLSSVSGLDPFRIKKLPKGIYIDSIDGNASPHLFTFEAISGSGQIIPSISSSDFDIQISYMGSSDSVLQKTIRYYTTSYISDF